jgi:PKD repeat protein
MPTYYSNINNAYVGALNNGTRARPFNAAQTELLVEGNLVNGVQAVNGDIIRVRGAYQGVAGIFRDMVLSLTITSWEDRRPWLYYYNGVGEQAYISAPTLNSVVFEDAIWLIEFYTQPAGVNGAANLMFRNCLFYAHVLCYHFGALADYWGDLVFSGCTFAYSNYSGTPIVEMTDNIANGPVTAYFNYCYFEENLDITDYDAAGQIVNFDRNVFTLEQANAITVGGAATTGLNTNIYGQAVLQNYPTYPQVLAAVLAGTFEDLVTYYNFGIPERSPAPSSWAANNITVGWWLYTRYGYGAFRFLRRLVVSATPENGKAPLRVTFGATVNGGPPVQWAWNFGDGNSSSESNPQHTYSMPGEYSGWLTVTFADGTTLRGYFVIYVYDFDYSGNVPNTSVTTVCYRTPVRANEGGGVSEYRDSFTTGLDWIWPPALVQIGMGYDLQKREIALVLDSKTQREYQINDLTAWRDRIGPYAGNIIRSQFWQKAHHSAEGEHVPIRHVEHHEYFKSFDRQAFQGAAGYDTEGLPLDLEVENQLFQDGEAYTPIVRARRIPIHGDLVFQEKVEARNLQLRTVILGAPYLITDVVPYYETVDKQTTPALRVMTETGYQGQLASMPYFHVSRNFNPILNLATAANVTTGTYSTLITGPDGRLYSAILFGTTDTGLRDTAPEAITGSFAAYLWVNNMLLATLPTNLIVLDNMRVRIVNAAGIHLMEIVHGAQTFNVGITYRGLNWTLFTIVRVGLELRVYENTTLLDTLALTLATAQGTNVQMGDASMAIFDPCIVPGTISLEAIEYYHGDVIRGGRQVLRPF